MTDRLEVVKVNSTVGQSNAEYLKEYKTIINESIRENTIAIEFNEASRKKEAKLLNEKCDKLEKLSLVLQKHLKQLKKNQEDKAQKLEDLIKEHEVNPLLEKKLLELNKVSNGLAISIEELKVKIELLESNKRVREEVVRERVYSEVEANEEILYKVTELENKLQQVEQNLKHTSIQLEKNDFNVRLAKIGNNMETKYEELVKSLEERLVSLEDNTKSTRTKFNNIENTIKENEKRIENKCTNLLTLHKNLTTRVDLLEKQLTTLRVNIQKKLSECAREFQAHREAIIELSNEKELMYQAEQVLVENVGVNVESMEKQVNAIKVGTDNTVIERQVQTDNLSFKAKEEQKVSRAIITNDKKAIPPKESSEVYNETPRAQSEYLSEETKEQLNLDKLIVKTPNRIILESPKQLTIGSLEADFIIKKRSPTSNWDIIQQTPIIEENRSTLLKHPSAYKEVLLSSPHYLREDPLRSRDRDNIIRTQGVNVEQNMSVKHFKRAQKFTVDLEDIANFGQDDVQRATYFEFIDYNAIDFYDYQPQVNEESSGGVNQVQLEERKSYNVTNFKPYESKEEDNSHKNSLEVSIEKPAIKEPMTADKLKSFNKKEQSDEDLIEEIKGLDNVEEYLQHSDMSVEEVSKQAQPSILLIRI